MAEDVDKHSEGEEWAHREDSHDSVEDIDGLSDSTVVENAWDEEESEPHWHWQHLWSNPCESKREPEDRTEKLCQSNVEGTHPKWYATNTKLTTLETHFYLIIYKHQLKI